MYDFYKIWIQNREQINTIITNPLLSFKGYYELNTGQIIIYPICCKHGHFTFELKSPTWLQITGSLHKFWNKGTNENDFSFQDAVPAIDEFCKTYLINPQLARIVNLEYGINVN